MEKPSKSPRQPPPELEYDYTAVEAQLQELSQRSSKSAPFIPPDTPPAYALLASVFSTSSRSTSSKQGAATDGDALEDTSMKLKTTSVVAVAKGNTTVRSAADDMRLPSPGRAAVRPPSPGPGGKNSRQLPSPTAGQRERAPAPLDEDMRMTEQKRPESPKRVAGDPVEMIKMTSNPLSVEQVDADLLQQRTRILAQEREQTQREQREPTAQQGLPVEVELQLMRQRLHSMEKQLVDQETKVDSVAYDMVNSLLDSAELGLQQLTRKHTGTIVTRGLVQSPSVEAPRLISPKTNNIGLFTSCPPSSSSQPRSYQQQVQQGRPPVLRNEVLQIQPYIRSPTHNSPKNTHNAGARDEREISTIDHLRKRKLSTSTPVDKCYTRPQQEVETAATKTKNYDLPNYGPMVPRVPAEEVESKAGGSLLPLADRWKALQKTRLQLFCDKSGELKTVSMFRARIPQLNLVTRPFVDRMREPAEPSPAPDNDLCTAVDIGNMVRKSYAENEVSLAARRPRSTFGVSEAAKRLDHQTFIARKSKIQKSKGASVKINSMAEPAEDKGRRNSTSSTSSGPGRDLISANVPREVTTSPRDLCQPEATRRPALEVREGPNRSMPRPDQFSPCNRLWRAA
ncbi:unnamed protein product [Amoebophrya sp. A25]|nr:unnamed protein product [Amoebophrya sp. A25]|eukprot:GSA25T00019496001.1